VQRSGRWTAIFLFLGAAAPAFAETVTFNLNSLTGYSSSAGNQESSIASQLTTQLHAICPSCTITATSGTAAVIDKTYNGEGYVVGPTSGGKVLSETLGNTPANATITSDSQYSYSQLK